MSDRHPQSHETVQRTGQWRGTGRLTRLSVAVLVVVAFVLPLAYAWVTSQAWEDFYISFRHSVNLAEGRGLTYQEGQTIQGFSSPLATLALAATYRLSGFSEAGALWIFRVLCAGAYASGLFLLLRATMRSGTAAAGLPLILPGLVYVLDLKSLTFTANGMETGLLLFFLAASLGCLAGDREHSGWALGAAWGGLLWTRPDGLIYVAAMGVALLLPREDRSLRLRSLLRATAVAAAIYLPWLLFAWWYYGSAVPQPVVAKATHAGILTGRGLLAAVGRVPEIWGNLYLQPYAEYAGWSLGKITSGVAGLLASSYWLLPGGRTFGRQASVVTFAGIVYLALMPRTFPWYFPIAVAASLPALAAWLSDLGSLARIPERLRTAAMILPFVALLATMTWLWRDSFWISRVVQEVSEDGNRRQIGLWLRENGEPSDTVYLECPGYIGYFSGLEMLDYPGLVSPPVVSARRILGDDFAEVGILLYPEWMVLRPSEVAYFQRQRPSWLESHYQLVRTFDVSARLEQAAPGRSGILYDSIFHVLRRRPSK